MFTFTLACTQRRSTTGMHAACMRPWWHPGTGKPRRLSAGWPTWKVLSVCWSPQPPALGMHRHRRVSKLIPRAHRVANVTGWPTCRCPHGSGSVIYRGRQTYHPPGPREDNHGRRLGNSTRQHGYSNQMSHAASSVSVNYPILSKDLWRLFTCTFYIYVQNYSCTYSYTYDYT